MYPQDRIIQAITEGKFQEALQLAKELPFTFEVLDLVIDNGNFELLWNLYRIAHAKGMNTGHFLLENVIRGGKIAAVDFFYDEKKLSFEYHHGLLEFDALSTACVYDQLDVVERLLNYGANPERIKDGLGRNAFFAATMSKDVNILRLLFHRTKRIDYVDSYGQTLLHAICTGGMERSDEIFDEILSHNGINVNAQDKFGNTALHMTLDELHRKSLPEHKIMALLDHPDIDLSIENHEGKTVLNLCREIEGPVARHIEDAIVSLRDKNQV